jgi:putative aldouronate transport system permease protein
MSSAQRAAAAPSAARLKPGYFLRRDIFLYMLLVLPMAHFIIFRYLPMYGVTIAFKEYNLFKGVFGSPWTGLANFREIVTQREFFQAVRNTLVLNGLDLVAGFPVPIVIALLLNELRSAWYKRAAQTLLYIPHFLSWIIIGGIVLEVLHPTWGLVNVALRDLGLQPIQFLTRPLNWIGTYLCVGIWQNMGWGTIIYLAAIAGINPELYEAAEVDGAGRMRKAWSITLPGIKSTIVILLILQIGRIAMINFERPFVLFNQRVFNVQDVIATFVYRVGLRSSRFSIATAVGLFQSVASLVFLMAANLVARRTGERGIW